jgi:hypothetical protein
MSSNSQLHIVMTILERCDAPQIHMPFIFDRLLPETLSCYVSISILFSSAHPLHIN